MSNLKAMHWRAINSYIKKTGFVPQLSAWPLYRFMDKETKEVTEIHIDNLMDMYAIEREKMKKERAEQRRLEKKNATRKVEKDGKSAN